MVRQPTVKDNKKGQYLMKIKYCPDGRLQQTADSFVVYSTIPVSHQRFLC